GVTFNPGEIQMTGGALFLNQSVTKKLTMSDGGGGGGRLGGSGVLTCAVGSSWDDGTMSGTGQTIVPAGVTLTLGAGTFPKTLSQIGRASCRDRVTVAEGGGARGRKENRPGAAAHNAHSCGPAAITAASKDQTT